MLHLSSYYRSQQSQQVDKLRSDVKSFQDNVLAKTQKISESLNRDHAQSYEVYLEVRQIKEEVKQMHTQINALVLHLLPPDPPCQAIENAITAITKYDGILQKRQQSLASTQTAWSDILSKLSSTLSPDTDG